MRAGAAGIRKRAAPISASYHCCAGTSAAPGWGARGLSIEWAARSAIYCKRIRADEKRVKSDRFDLHARGPISALRHALTFPENIFEDSSCIPPPLADRIPVQT